MTYEDELILTEEELFECPDPDYGERFACLRSEFEESPDGFHITRPLWSISDHERNQTENLFKREVNRIAKLFNLPVNRHTQKEIYKILKMWYKLGYDFKSLEKSIRDGYFKHIEDIENFCLIMDDSYSDIITSYFETKLTEGKTRRIALNEELEETDCDCQEEGSVIDENFIERLVDISEKIKNAEYSILENLSSGKDRDYWKTQLKKLSQLKEELLIEVDLTYDDVILLWYEMQHAKNSGYVKYPIYTVFNQKDFEDKDYEKLQEITDRIRTVEKRINYLEECIRCPEENDIDPEEIQDYQKELEHLQTELSFLKKCYVKTLKEVDPDHSVIEEIYRLLKEIKNAKNGRVAYKKSEMAKFLISKIKDKVRRYAYYKTLDRIWKERKANNVRSMSE